LAVRDHTYNLAIERNVAIAKCHVSPYGILITKEVPDKSLVDNHHFVLRTVIAFIEFTPGNHGNSQRVKIVCGEAVLVAIGLLVFLRAIALDGNVRAAIRLAEWAHIGSADGLDSRKQVESPLQFAEES